ncbi:MAG TPA: GMC family oxidoreductase N-terminal domain-containing protein [Beijerinckiaceae bacterium]
METFDTVIVGGGAAGCVLAARLSEDPRRTVLLVEAGDAKPSLWVTIPAAFGKAWKDPRFNWAFATEPEAVTHDRAIAFPRGKSLGGSTLINGGIWVRGQPEDFDGWAQSGATGWGYEDVLPFFKRLEAYPGGDGERGRAGPVTVEQVQDRHPLPEAFITAAGQAGYPLNPDYNGRNQEGFGYYQNARRSGRRLSAADAYLAPALRRPHLVVRTGALATGLVLDGRRVTGLRYRRGGQDETVSARREVVLAAGAVQSPHLLELSGIGDPAVLAGAGIAVRHALPGVGRNYRDHYATRINWRVSQPITLNELTRGWHLGKAVAEYALFRRGILALSTGIAHGFVRSRPELATPDIQYFFVHASYANAADRVLDRKPGMTIGVTQLRPQSHGTIHAVSPDPLMPPAIRPNLLADPLDQEALVAGMRIARRIIEQPAMDPYRAFEMNPGPDIRTDEDFADFARRTGQTIYHPVGTCRMGTGPDAVVDPALKVCGIEGLRVADASVMPMIVSANTQAATMMIAEKAADLMRAER